MKKAVAAIIFVIMWVAALLLFSLNAQRTTLVTPPFIAANSSYEELYKELGIPIASLTEIKIWKNSDWTLVCGFKNGILRDYHVIDHYGRRIAGTVKKEKTVRKILQNLSSMSNEELRQSYGEEDSYLTESGLSVYGKIGYDGGIVLYEASPWREVFDYKRIDAENPYKYTPAWMFFLSSLF